MKIRLLLPLVSLAISFALPTSAQQKDMVDPVSESPEPHYPSRSVSPDLARDWIPDASLRRD
jgi:hypothetical protein